MLCHTATDAQVPCLAALTFQNFVLSPRTSEPEVVLLDLRSITVALFKVDPKHPKLPDSYCWIQRCARRALVWSWCRACVQ